MDDVSEEVGHCITVPGTAEKPRHTPQYDARTFF